MLIGILLLPCYFIGAATLAIWLKARFNLPKELMRKILHLIIVMAVFIYVYAFPKWYMAAITALVFAAVVYPLIVLAERHPRLMSIFNERKKGEIRNSLLAVHFMYALLITLFWGVLGPQWKYIIVVAILAWGFGDAAAALVGKKWGRRKITHRWVDKNKTLEGTLAMWAVAGVVLVVTLLVYSGQPWYLVLLTALVVAPVCAGVELVSQGGVDTVTVPLSAAIPTFALLYLFSVMGVWP